MAKGFPGGTYTGLFYVACVDAAGPAADGEIHVELDEADFLAVFPLKRTGHLRLIGPISWDPRSDPERLRHYFLERGDIGQRTGHLAAASGS